MSYIPSVTDFGGASTGQTGYVTQLPSIQIAQQNVRSPEHILRNIGDDNIITELKNIYRLDGTPLLNFHDYGSTIEIISYIKDANDKREAINFLKLFAQNVNGEISWDLPTMGKFEEQYLHNIKLEFLKLKGTKSTEPCSGCGAFEVYKSSMQTRSADESTTIRVKCASCGKGWNE